MTAIAALVTLLVGCTVPPSKPASDAMASADAVPVLGDAEIAGLVDGMVKRTPKVLVAERLAEGLTPPTNRWYSGLVFGAQPQPVFPLPLGFSLTADGFALGLPQLRTTPAAIMGGFAADLSIGVGAASSIVAGDDASVVVVDHLDKEGRRIGSTTIAQGSPFVAFAASRDVAVDLGGSFEPVAEGVFQRTVGTTRYALSVEHGTVEGTTVRIAEGGRVTFWPVPAGRPVAELADASRVRLSGSRTSFEVGDEQVTTELTYLTGGDTVIARMPHQADPSATCELGSYPSIYGTLQLCAGSSVRWNTRKGVAAAELDLSGLTDGQRRTLADQVKSDVAALPAFPADTYFGGKALQRAAMLLSLARQLGLSAEGDALARTLDAELTKWTDPQGCAKRDAFCFVYDPEGKGMVGLTPSFGSDEYNDHHFHYGYFLYAAAVVAHYDPTAAQRYAPVLNLVAADLAGSGNSWFPDRRVFDSYASHSWASGTAPFADGNNQESVSEAVNAWAGLTLWATATDNRPLAAEASWMLALEQESSRRYWTDVDLSGPEFVGYDHGIVVLNWGGKRDYATWFSAEPAAMLGILLLPMSPSSGYLATNADRIRANVEEAAKGGFDQKFGDYLLMYSALAGAADRDRALSLAAALPDSAIDDGISRSYLLAWLMSRRF